MAAAGTRTWLALGAVALLGGLLAWFPTWHKGLGPRVAVDNLLAARTLALTGVAAIEDGEQGVLLGTAEARQRGRSLPPTAAGNRLTYQLHGRAMALVPELQRHPHWLTALLAALAAGLVAALGARVRPGGAGPALAAGLLYMTLPVVLVAASSPAHLDLAAAASAGVWLLVLGPRRAPRPSAILIAGLLAGVASLARDSFVVLAPVAALTLLGGYPEEEDRPPAWRRLLAAICLCAVAAAVFLLGGGSQSVYLDQEARGREYHRLGHGFPDFYTAEHYLTRAGGKALTPEELAGDELLQDLDPRLAAIYAGLGDPTPGGTFHQLLARARASLSFYPRAAITLNTLGGPLPLGLCLLGLVAAGLSWRRSPLSRALLGGGSLFLLFHAALGTSNSSHLLLLGPPLALALGGGVDRVARGQGPTRIWLLPTVLGLVLLQQLLAGQVAMSHLYNGAGASRYGCADARDRARQVAATPGEGRVLVGTRGEDALAIAFLAERSAVVLAPRTLAYLARRGELRAFLEAHRIDLVAGYSPELCAQPEVAQALEGLVALPWSRP